jgi:subtilisin
MVKHDGNGATLQPGFTGRVMVLLDEAAAATASSVLGDAAGLSVASAAELGPEPVALDAVGADGITFPELGVAILDAHPDQVAALHAAVASERPVLAVEAERIVYALETSEMPGAPGSPTGMPFPPLAPPGMAYGWNAVGVALPTAAAPLLDESRATWGLQATSVLSSAFTGRGIRVAVLDTGFDVDHPDFAGRNPVTRSFVPGEQVQDGHGHGTHCIGTALGSRTPGQLPRYGIASEAQIYAGKVLSNRGSGTDSGILAGIDWAIANGCQVVSMSLGADVPWGTPYSQVFEAVGARALARGTLIVAAAGNASRRESGLVNPVGHPANCPSLLAVAAIDSGGRIASFSSTSDPKGGAVDIAGPGVQVYSSWPLPTRYRTISGTSMATPHVAGIAALHSQARGLTGLQLWAGLMQTARRLQLSSADVGCGLVQAP